MLFQNGKSVIQLFDALAGGKVGCVPYIPCNWPSTNPFCLNEEAVVVFDDFRSLFQQLEMQAQCLPSIV